MAANNSGKTFFSCSSWVFSVTKTCAPAKALPVSLSVFFTFNVVGSYCLAYKFKASACVLSYQKSSPPCLASGLIIGMSINIGTDAVDFIFASKSSAITHCPLANDISVRPWASVFLKAFGCGVRGSKSVKA